MELQQNMNKSTQKVHEFNPHVDRVIRALDDIYEFGISALFTYAATEENGINALKKILDKTAPPLVNQGLRRLRDLEQRKRVCPWPVEFEKICVVSDEDWIEMKGNFERS